MLHRAEPNWGILRGLVDRAQESIADASRSEVGLATRFASAYSAAFWLARAALEAAGYRLAGAEGNRTTAFQCLAHTVEWDDHRWRELDDLHRFRNRFDYGDLIDVSEQQVVTLTHDAQELLESVRQSFPQLNPED
jgi:uncharacterized protein (UPF0332 family)